MTAAVDTALETAEFGLVPNTRRLRGLVVPFGETGHNARGPFEFSLGSVTLPTEPLELWVGHDHAVHLGRSVLVETTDKGVEAEFEIDPGYVGDRLLAEYAKGKKHSLSAEFSAAVRDGKKVLSSVLTGVAAVVLGGFESAAFFALADPAQQSDVESIADAIRALPADVREALDEALQTTEADQAEDTEADEAPQEKETETMAEATAPQTAAETVVDDKDLSAADVFDLVVSARKSGDRAQLAAVREAEVDTFALSDIKTSGTGSLGVNTIQAGWLGEIWNGDGRERNIVPLLKHGNLTSFEVKGFYFSTPPTMASWTGNKSAIASPAVAVATRTAGIQRFAAGYDLAREFLDISAGREVISSFIAKLVESYKTVSDDYVLAQLVAATTTTVAAAPPAGVAAGWSRVIQGAQKLRTNGAQADFAVMAADVYDALAFTKEQDRLALFSQAGNFNGGSLSNIKLVVSNQLAAGQVLVGDSRAATVFELPGAPIRVNALDIANGGVDEAVYAYVSVLVENPTALALITNA